jgi:hypothetical protein
VLQFDRFGREMVRFLKLFLDARSRRLNANRSAAVEKKQEEFYCKSEGGRVNDRQ